jgi:superfamily II DNA helicase RecQ
LLSNTSNSGFIARHVASYVTQVKSLTLPELRNICALHKLNQQGKKAQLLSRLAIWVRDEISKGLNEDDYKGDENSYDECVEIKNSDEIEHLSKGSNLSKDDQQKASVDISVDTAFNDCNPKKGNISNTTDAINCGSESFNDTSDDEDDELELFHEGTLGATHNSFPSANEDAMQLSNTRIESDIDFDSKDLLHKRLWELFGFDKFRAGQEWAIHRTLQGERSLLVAPTGLGKSLCYTLPAALMDGVCIVVSPLLSLIQDQIRLLPARIPAVTLSGPISAGTMVSTLDDIAKGRIKIVFVSPERLSSTSFRRLFRKVWNPTTKQYDNPKFPPVSLLCIDEAHCLSQWAHNFRPSYLRLRSVIDIIHPKSILALTATAGPKLVRDLCASLNIQQPSTTYNEMITVSDTENAGVRISKTDRDNIDVQCFILVHDDDRLVKVSSFLSEVIYIGSIMKATLIPYCPF